MLVSVSQSPQLSQPLQKRRKPYGKRNSRPSASNFERLQKLVAARQLTTSLQLLSELGYSDPNNCTLLLGLTQQGEV